MDFIKHFGICILGIIIYNIWVFRKHLSKPKLLMSKAFWDSFWLESKFKLMWCVLFALSISTTISISPDTAISIKDLTGLDLQNNLSAYFTFGLGVSSLVDTKNK
jgi:hypothetical protein